MPCDTAKTMRFRVYEKSAAQTDIYGNYSYESLAYDTGKEFTCTLAESNEYRARVGYGSSEFIHGNYILLQMFKLYGFESERGFVLSWASGALYIKGYISWRGTAWEIRRVV